jgi:hypothetical protein
MRFNSKSSNKSGFRPPGAGAIGRQVITENNEFLAEDSVKCASDEHKIHGLVSCQLQNGTCMTPEGLGYHFPFLHQTDPE